MIEIKKCCFCGKMIIGDGKRPHPLINDRDNYNNDVCCDYCYATKVIPYAVRLDGLSSGRGFRANVHFLEEPDGTLYINDMWLSKEED